MKVHELMTPDPAYCNRDTDLTEVAQMMAEQNCGEIPVCRDRIPIGVLTDRDITMRTVARNKNPLEMKAGDCMTFPCITVKENETAEACMELMKEHKVRRLPVINKKGECCGIISQADLAKQISRGQVGEVVEEVSRG
jgi:CBS domain-containing protein